MSYAVAVIVPPITEDDAAAWTELETYAQVQGPPPPVFESLHRQLTERFPCISTLPDDDVDDGAWSDGPLWNNFGRKAAVLGISPSRVDEVLPFLIEVALAHELSVFDWSTGRIHRPEGLQGYTLTIEDLDPFAAPTILQIVASVDMLTDGGPGFLVLEGPNEDYAQTARDGGGFIAEWREHHAGGGFTHWKAGRTRVSAANGAFDGGTQQEILNADEVKRILSAFAKGEGRPAEFHWRDMTAEFNSEV